MLSVQENEQHTKAAFPRGRWWERDSGIAVPEAALDDDPHVEYATGASTVPGECDLTQVNDPRCRTFVPICGMRRVGAIVRSPDANGALAVSPWAIIIAPNKTSYFLPRAVRMQVTSNANPAIAQWVFITAVHINDFPQESVHTVPAVAATRAGFSSQDYVAPDGYGVPVPWGIFSQANLIENLQLNGFNFFGAGADVAVSVWGHPLSAMPSGLGVGMILTEAQKDEIAMNYAAP